MSFFLFLIRFLLRVRGFADVMLVPSPSIAPRPLASRPDRDRRHLRPAADRRPARSPRRTSVLQLITILPAVPGTIVPLRIAVQAAATLPAASSTTVPRRGLGRLPLHRPRRTATRQPSSSGVPSLPGNTTRPVPWRATKTLARRKTQEQPLPGA